MPRGIGLTRRFRPLIWSGQRLILGLNKTLANSRQAPPKAWLTSLNIVGWPVDRLPLSLFENDAGAFRDSKSRIRGLRFSATGRADSHLDLPRFIFMILLSRLDLTACLGRLQDKAIWPTSQSANRRHPKLTRRLYIPVSGNRPPLSSRESSDFHSNIDLLTKVPRKDTWTLQLDPLLNSCAHFSRTDFEHRCTSYLQIGQNGVSACKIVILLSMLAFLGK